MSADDSISTGGGGMNPAKVVEFPCPSGRCIQVERLAVLEAKEREQAAALDRIEHKIDRLLWWITGTCLAVAGGSLAALVQVLMSRVGK